MNIRRNISATLLWVVFLIIFILLDLFYGSRMSGSGEADIAVIITRIRLPRIITAIIAGSSLSLAGVQMQSILRNPLADPHIMGISSGASLGAASATLIGGSIATGSVLQGLPVAIAAIAGALLTSFIIIAAGKRLKSAMTLLIFGVMLGFIANAVITVMQSNSNAESLKIFHSWSAGSFATTSWREILILVTTLSAAVVLSAINHKGLDIILFGDEFAELASISPQKTRFLALLSCCLITGAVTAFCGPIGFVGITAPHIARGFWKTSAHRTIIPASLLCGGTIGVAADLLSYTGSIPIPISSTMAIAGVPVILYILVKQTGTEL